MDSKKPYVEIVAGIHNILKFLHIEYRIMNYNELPTAHKMASDHAPHDILITCHHVW